MRACCAWCSSGDAGGSERALIEKIEALPPEKKVEVEDFVDLVARRERERQSPTRRSERFPP
jgi:hypothetical protein